MKFKHWILSQSLIIILMLGLIYNNVIVSPLGQFSQIFLQLVFLLLVFVLSMAIIDRIYVHKHMEFGETGKYAAVVIVKKEPDDDMTLYLNGISFLLLYFKNVNKHYKVFEYPTIERFKQIIGDKNADELYIFGHGTRSQLYFEETHGKPLKYEEFENYPKKKFVGQYHCNPCCVRRFWVDVLFFAMPFLHTCDSDCGKSLAYYLSSPEEDVTKTLRVGLFTQIKFIRKWITSVT